MSLTVCFSSRAGFVVGGGFMDLALWTPCSCSKNEISDWPVFSAVSSAVSPELLMDFVLLIPL